MVQPHGKHKDTTGISVPGGGYVRYSLHHSRVAWLLFLALLLPILVHATGTQFGGSLWYDGINGRLGIGVNNPTEVLDVNGNGRFSGTLTSQSLPVPRGLATSTATSPLNSSNKTLTVWCPPLFKATGGGGQVVQGNNDDIVLNASFPTATTSGWMIEYRESDPVGSNWSVQATVMCTKV